MKCFMTRFISQGILLVVENLWSLLNTADKSTMMSLTNQRYFHTASSQLAIEAVTLRLRIPPMLHKLKPSIRLLKMNNDKTFNHISD
jgi:hypothetical protein